MERERTASPFKVHARGEGLFRPARPIQGWLGVVEASTRLRRPSRGRRHPGWNPTCALSFFQARARCRRGRERESLAGGALAGPPSPCRPRSPRGPGSGRQVTLGGEGGAAAGARARERTHSHSNPHQLQFPLLLLFAYLICSLTAASHAAPKPDRAREPVVPSALETTASSGLTWCEGERV